MPCLSRRLTGMERFKKVQILSVPVAFLIHGLLMFLAMVLTIAGIALAEKEFPDVEGRVQYSHGTMGWIIFSFVISQVLAGAALRPACCMNPDRPSFPAARLIFGVCHRTGGFATMIVAIITVMQGAQNYKVLRDEDGARAYRAIAGVGFLLFAILYVVFEVCWCVRVCAVALSSRVQRGQMDRNRVTNAEAVEAA